MKLIAVCLLVVIAVTFGELTVWQFDSFKIDRNFISIFFHCPRLPNGEWDRRENIGLSHWQHQTSHYPYQASLQVHSTQFRHVCGAAIISPTRVLTTAACIDTKIPIANYSIVAGTNTTHSPVYRRQLSRYIRHLRYNAQNRTNDIAVLHLASPLPVNAIVRPVALPRRGQPLPYEQAANITGFGSPDHKLRVAWIRVNKEAACKSAYNGIAHISNGTFCAGSGSPGICEGDFGGPIVHNSLLIGVSS